MSKKVAAPAKTPTKAVGNLIRKQREAMQMTVAQLAGRIGVSRNTITNYEAGKTEPSASDLVRLSGALGCAIGDLLHGGAAAPPRFAFRAHVPLRRDPAVTLAARKYLRAYDEIEEIMNSRLCGKLRKFICGNDGPLTDREIEMAADTLRQTSGLHDTGPENIASVLEGLGVRTLFFDHEGKGLEGLSTIQGEMVLVMLRNRKKVVERTIFDAAHELGHLVLHPELFTSDNDGEEVDIKRYEQEANKFAGNFLVPSDEIVRIWKEERLNKLSLFNALILLKRVFHVSFHCLYHRVTELKLHPPVDRAVFTNQIKQQLGIVGPATMEDLEPDPLEPDVLYRTNRFSRLVRSAFLQELIGVSKVAEMFQVTVDRAQEIITDWLRPKHELVEDGPYDTCSLITLDKTLLERTSLARQFPSGILALDESFMADQMREETAARLRGRVTTQVLPSSAELAALLSTARLSRALSAVDTLVFATAVHVRLAVVTADKRLARAINGQGLHVGSMAIILKELVADNRLTKKACEKVLVGLAGEKPHPGSAKPIVGRLGQIRVSGRVAPGSYPPGAPTDPDLPN